MKLILPATCVPFAFAILSVLLPLPDAVDVGPISDWRELDQGLTIPSEGYCDQPYVVVLPSGKWLCVMTTGKGNEGSKGQHVVSTISTDRGKTWSKLINIEPADGPEASWAVPLLTPSGRVYVFYDYNGDRIAELDKRKIRTDMLGWYVYKFSDDGGLTWSKLRYRLPMRLTQADRNNDWKGKVQIFWGICKPQQAEGSAYFSFTKLGKYMLDQGEGWLYRSDNILTEKNPAMIRWDLWPEGDKGIRSPREGSVQEEHNMVWLGGKNWYCVYRTTQGYPCHTYSQDDGKTWEAPTPMTYTPEGSMVRNPRACPKLFRTKEGNFLFWFHNHSGKSFDDRNPAWISGGVLRDGKIHWSQPEILLYAKENPKTRMSYPDLIEQDGRYWFTETIKHIARVHEIPSPFLQHLWRQGQEKTITRKRLWIEAGKEILKKGVIDLPGPLALRQGMSLEFWVRFDKFAAKQVLFDSRTASGEGLFVATKGKTIRVELNDGKTKAHWETDEDIFQSGKTHHVVVTVDAGPRMIMFLVDGRLCDGAGQRQFGWGRYPAELRDVSGTRKLLLGPSLQGNLLSVRLYQRPLTTSEAVNHYHAGP
ncbi:MAG: hypothetical protein EBV06_12550 [Planctomycetia bacterium]|nr:hypothetical protein [Planctomycetia bacterium]